MRVSCALLLLFTIGFIDSCYGARILGIYGIPVKSHFHWLDQLFKGLVKKGHQVDIITPFPMKEKHPNYTQIITFNPTKEITQSLDLIAIRKFAEGQDMQSLAAFGHEACVNMDHPEFLKLARNPPKDRPYDLIITQMFTYHCFMVLGHLWNIPVVLVSTTSLYPWLHDAVANPENVAISPNNLFAIPEGNTFWSRFWNAYYFYRGKFSFQHHSRSQNDILQKHFGPNVPDIRELERSAALVLMNTYFPVNGIKPMAKAVVEVGGLHIQNQGPELTDSLKKWLDESKDGVIYFNLGTILKIETFPEETVKVVFAAMAKKAPMRVLMRINKPELLTVPIPSNVYALPWVAQEKVLQHPNVRLFVTHGGLLGTQEAVHYGVPMLCLPVMVDQFTNSQNYVEKKIAITIDVFSLTEEMLDKALNEVLNNPIYRNNIKKLAKLFRDRPQSAMDTAIYWTEYILRHGKDALRSPAMDLTWWQLALLDVLAVWFGGILFVICIIGVGLKMFISLLSRYIRPSVTKEKKNK